MTHQMMNGLRYEDDEMGREMDEEDKESEIYEEPRVNSEVAPSTAKI